MDGRDTFESKRYDLLIFQLMDFLNYSLHFVKISIESFQIRSPHDDNVESLTPRGVFFKDSYTYFSQWSSMFYPCDRFPLSHSIGSWTRQLLSSDDRQNEFCQKCRLVAYELII